MGKEWLSIENQFFKVQVYSLGRFLIYTWTTQESMDRNTADVHLTLQSDPNCAQNHNESIIYSSESAKASMTTAYHSYKLENLHPFCEYDFIVSTQIEPKNEYETLNSTRFISPGVKAKGKIVVIIPYGLNIRSTLTVDFLEKKLHPLQASIYQYRYFKWQANQPS